MANEHMLKNKVAIVTGGGAGIGYAVATEFAIEGAKVVIGGQILGFSTGEWKGVRGKPRRYIYTAITILFISMIILAIGNMLS